MLVEKAVAQRCESVTRMGAMEHHEFDTLCRRVPADDSVPPRCHGAEGRHIDKITPACLDLAPNPRSEGRIHRLDGLVFALGAGVETRVRQQMPALFENGNVLDVR